MTRNTRLYLALLLGCASAHAAPADRTPTFYADVEGWAFAEPVPVTAFADDWRAPLDRGSDGMALLHVESGVLFGVWRLGWVLQRQYVIEASRGAAELYHLTRNRLDPPANGRFDVDLHATFYEARGLRIGHLFSGLPLGSTTLQLEPSVVLWEGVAFEDGNLRGYAKTDAEASLQYAAVLDHAYSEDTLLDRQIGRPTGRGASLDLNASLTDGDAWGVHLDARNLLARLWWRDAPYTVGELGSETQQTDDQGLIRFDPTLSGFEGQRSHRQRMPAFARLVVHRALGTQRWGAGLVHTEIGTFASMLWDRDGRWFRYGLEWTPSARQALAVHVGWGAMQITIGGNAWRWDDAEQLSVRVSFDGGRR